MNLDHYQFKLRSDYHEYEFYSDGPIGRIRKIVRFGFVKSRDIPFYNLAFGDWMDGTNYLDDTTVSNNGDKIKVLSTIATIVLYFTGCNPNAIIYAEGSTPARTRLYQMGINQLWSEVKMVFQVYGVKSDGILEPFRKNENYHGFYARRIHR